jgi:hypothetical protein
MWLILFNPDTFGSEGPLAAQLIAAYINAQVVAGYPLKQGVGHQDVTNMWAMRKDGWCPNAWTSNMTCSIERKWKADEILDYLSNYANTDGSS